MDLNRPRIEVENHLHTDVLRLTLKAPHSIQNLLCPDGQDRIKLCVAVLNVGR